MLKINGVEIGNKRKLTDFLKRNQIDSIENIGELNKLYNIDFDDGKLESILSLLKEYGKITLKYINKVNNQQFSVDKFHEYVNFFKDNPKCRSVVKIWSVIYGDDEAKRMFSEKQKNVITPFSVEYWVNKGFTEEESLIKTNEYRVRCGSKLENFIKRHGEELGRIKYDEFREKSKHTLETYITKYGHELGTLKYDEYIKTKDSNSFEWALKKSNGDVELAEKIFKERKEGVKTSLESMIRKYGDVELAKEKLIELNKKKDSASVKYFLKKCGGNRRKAKKLYEEASKKKDCMSLNYFLRKCYGDLEMAKLLQEKEFKKRDVSFFTASKESLKIFIPLYRFLRKNGICREDIYLGISGSKEFKIFNEQTNKTYSYDFTIQTLKMIVEYHGEVFHPNVDKYGFEYLKENWGKYFNFNLEEKIEFDLTKKKVAIQNGYEYIEIWSSDSEDVIRGKLLKIKNKIYEN